MTLTYLFTYGSLREGQPLDHYMRNHVDHGNATINGRIYEYGEGSFPVVDLDAEGTIVGEVYALHERDPLLAWCMQMEKDSGYVPRQVTATLANGSTAEVTALHFPHKEWYGDRIESGDWLEHVKRHGQSTRGFN